MSGFNPNPSNVLDAAATYAPLMSEAEKLNLVLKKVMGVPNTRPEDTDSVFRELPRPSRFAVFNQQIYAERIPDDSDASGGTRLLTHAEFGWEEDGAFDAAGGATRRYTSRRFPHVAYYTQLPLAPAFMGSRQAFSHPLLAGAVPNTLADVYTPTVYDSTGGTALSLSHAPYIIDGDAGILTFYDNARSLVDAAHPPRVTFYRYEGPRGAAAPGLWLRDASSGTVYCDSAPVAVGKAVALTGATLDVSGDLVATTVRAERHVTLSDPRLKQDVEPLGPGVLARVLQLSGYRYRLVAGALGSGSAAPSAPELGMMADEVGAQFPELIFETRDGYKMMMYDRMAAVLVEALKEQQGVIAGLQARLGALERGGGGGARA